MAELEAGPETNARVAEQIFGQVVCRTRADIPEGWRLDNGQTVPGYCDGTFVYTLPDYSDDIAAALQVVEKMQVAFGLRGHNGFLLTTQGEGELLWYCEFPAPAWEDSSADTAPLAICKAALRAVGALEPA